MLCVLLRIPTSTNKPINEKLYNNKIKERTVPIQVLLYCGILLLGTSFVLSLQKLVMFVETNKNIYLFC